MSQQLIEQACALIQSRVPDFRPEVAVVLGSGLGPFADNVDLQAEIGYEELPGFPEAGVGGHAGRLLLGRVAGTAVAVLQGRTHYYEDGRADAMKLPIRTLAAIGCNTLLLTNAAGSLLYDSAPGSVMLLSDHLNMAGVSPLFGERGNERFVSMADAYDPALRRQLLAVAERRDISLPEGVYAWMSGPQFETPAEIAMLKTLGADAVGMSTVPEVILARHQGLRVAALSIITNYAAGMSDTALSHEQTIEYAARAADTVQQLLTGLLEEYRS